MFMMMKKIFLSVLGLLLLSPVLFAQFLTNQTDIFLKWAPASLAVGKITVGGEYNFKEKNSIEVFIGIPVTINRRLEYDGKKSNMNSKAYSILGGYRRYLGQQPSSGFYLEPFVKYLKHKSSGILEGNLSGEKALFNSITNYQAFGAGLQLGVHFIVAKRISLDIFFLGPEANAAKFTSSATDITNALPWTIVEADEARKDIRDAIDDIPIIDDKLEITVNQNQKTVYTKYSGFLPGIRFGTSVGIRL